eukprot:CAMPEP_0197655676 /NCGR_PEP_ID=MMETSP1338-20131121/39598_1 /TAXON_ID=43686 ORGANISM="Pelagodinium beii, Strain RCC1491" /NCGR_SAMPLE_ID=MMETSP1338 /ASSEMBLY_ACC=CAM_ASM_000754 /LENGTH=254 /DNA_ID=CAMNT_0043231371 /DNA_START=41 /DNA_END=802 /DNA_ORIENTATION=-
MAATRRTLAHACSKPALPCANSELALPKVSRKALGAANCAQKREQKRSATRQRERFDRRPELSAVEEHDEVWWDADPVPCCPAMPKPKPYADVVQKEHPKLHVFQNRVMLVENGWLYWSSDTQSSLARLHKKTWRGCIDLASTPCEVGAVDCSDTLFQLEPLPGCRWSANDVHSRKGTRTAFVFNARSPQERENWMNAISEHMHYKIAAGSMPSMPVRPEAGTCSVCLGDLGDGRSVCKTPCNHTFHAQCLQQW